MSEENSRSWVAAGSSVCGGIVQVAIYSGLCPWCGLATRGLVGGMKEGDVAAQFPVYLFSFVPVFFPLDGQ